MAVENNKSDSKKEKKTSSSEKIDLGAEKFIEDVLSSIQTKTEDFGKKLSDYKTELQKPLTDVIETENGLVVKMDLPGVKKEDIDLQMAEDQIIIKTFFEEKSEEVKYLQKERSHGKTIRTLTLPFSIDVEKVKADFDNSILTIKLPKIEKEVHKVDIE
ncbi:Hsp20/alpha crystallin family protein [Methanobacterium movens]